MFHFSEKYCMTNCRAIPYTGIGLAMQWGCV